MWHAQHDTILPAPVVAVWSVTRTICACVTRQAAVGIKPQQLAGWGGVYATTWKLHYPLSQSLPGRRLMAAVCSVSTDMAEGEDLLSGFCSQFVASNLRLSCTLTSPLSMQPEPHEFLEHKQQLVLERVASTAATRVARSFSRQQSALSTTHSSFNSTKPVLLRAFSSMRANSVHIPVPAHATADAAGGKGADPCAVTSPKGSIAAGRY